MPAGWEHFPHGADVGVRGTGKSLADAFAEAALAMIAAAVDDLDAVALRDKVEISCSGADPEDLLYAWLNAVIYEMAVRRMVFARFQVKVDGQHPECRRLGRAIAAGAASACGRDQGRHFYRAEGPEDGRSVGRRVRRRRLSAWTGDGLELA
jgi:SHS2 domain-containing protein